MNTSMIDCDVLVTGASGFIGSHYVAFALQNNLKVVVTSRSNASVNLKEADENKIHDTYLDFDLSNRASICRLFSKIRPKAVVHAAAMCSAGGADGFDLISGDVASTYQLMECAVDAKVERFVMLGSAQVYGGKDKPHCECDPLAPSNPYGLMKALCAENADYFRRQSTMKIIETRLFNVYGVDDKPPRLLPYLLERMQDDLPIELSAGDQERDFVYIDDVVRIIAQAAAGHIPYDCINVGTGQVKSVKAMAEHLHHILKSKSEMRFGARPMQEGEAKVLKADTSRLKELGLIPTVNVFDGLSKIVEGLDNEATG
ncbi:MAG: NAD-dependent epimerase/dehydratase family protein [Hyphomicrobiales bacterium]